MIEVSSEQSRSQFICIHSAAAVAAAAALLLLLPVFLLRRHRVRFHNRVPGPDYNYYTVRCCTTYEHVFVYTCLLLCSVLLYCCCCCCCCLSSCAGWQKLLLWFTVPGCSDLFLFIDTIYFQCTPWQYCLIYSVNFLPIIHAWYHTSSILRACEEPRRALGRRGASLRGRLPPATLPHKEII